uniref:STAS domain-containing protein n=1 Tax=Clastoptera arizonana TaxID=38151 RepID=A0A1B6BXI7_9HEMI
MDETIPLLKEDPPPLTPRSKNTFLRSNIRVQIDRPVYEHRHLKESFNSFENARFNYVEVRSNTECFACAKSCIVGTIPALGWLRNYKWKEELLPDVIAGCTVAVMNIPQGMAYALLGNVPPVVGIYMAIFPVIAYSLLGTSRHISMGAFAVICLMTGNIVNAHANIDDQSLHNATTYTPLQVATAITFTVGIFQVGMYIFQLGIICSLLSDNLVNGLTAGAAVHVLTSQIKDLFGMKIKKYSGNFQIVYTYISVISNFNTVNIAATTVSAITLFFLIFNAIVIKPWVKKRSQFPVPIEFIVILVGTYVFKIWRLADQYDLDTVGHIEVGLPSPTLPTLSIVPNIIWDSFVIALVAYVISISMALIFSQKLNYEINTNQELLAQGAGNLLGSCFSCLPFSASLSRSVIQESVGGRTQLSSLVCVSILVVVISLFADIFETLPKCILASLILVALKGVLWQVKDIVKIWKLSISDGLVFLITYLTVVLVEIDVGLLIGIVISNLSNFIKSIKPNIYEMGRLPNTEIYVDVTRYNDAKRIKGILIIHSSGVINFLNQRHYKQKLLQLVKKGCTGFIEDTNLLTEANEIILPELEFVILDLTSLHYVDTSGATILKSISKELSNHNNRITLATKPGPVYDVLQKCGVFADLLNFPTVHDAVTYIEHIRGHVIETNCD